jgi:hypothetical protein
MKLTLAAMLMAMVAEAAEVTFFRAIDCNQDDKIGDVLSVPDESGNVAHAIFHVPDKPVSMLVIGYATVLLTQNENTIFSQPTCAYCANYYTRSGDCTVGDGQKCVNIDTGWGPGHAELIAVGERSPADIPCRNFLINCDFPVPPGNGFCAQS